MSKKHSVKHLLRDFTSEDNRSFRLKLGYTIASSLTGLIAGVIVSSIIWYQALIYTVESIKNICIK